ncbi:MAG: guanylate kinase [Leptospiraceae bacterium]|nr:guanylate kinase [Leptospiraceae bacterium]MCP5500507.1 guanylate kinase [Leptospiraceae bacterium]
MNNRKGKLYIISSVAGGGKTTLINKLLNEFPDLQYSISYTSRPKRNAEVHSKDYFFVDREEFFRLIQEDFFFEWALVHNNYYGTPSSPILDAISSGQKIILDIDIKGARTVRSKVADSCSVFILPPSEEIWRDRLVKRGTESAESLQIRLANGKKELEYAGEFDYTIINDSLEKAYSDLKRIMGLRKEELKS